MIHSDRTDGGLWRCVTVLDKIRGDDPTAEPYDQIEVVGNVLTIGGSSALWDRMVATSPTATQLTEAGTVIGVGTSATTAVNTQTELQGAADSSNRYYKAMEAGFPAHTHSVSDTAALTTTFKASFGTTLANFAWREWGVGRGTAGVGGTGSFTIMLNRRVYSFGTKTSADTWNLTVTLTIT